MWLIRADLESLFYPNNLVNETHLVNPIHSAGDLLEFARVNSAIIHRLIRQWVSHQFGSGAAGGEKNRKKCKPGKLGRSRFLERWPRC